MGPAAEGAVVDAFAAVVAAGAVVVVEEPKSPVVEAAAGAGAALVVAGCVDEVAAAPNMEGAAFPLKAGRAVEV